MYFCTKILAMLILLAIWQSNLSVRARELYKQCSRSKLTTLHTIAPKEDLSYCADTNALFNEAMKKHQAGDLKEAKQLFAQILKLDPNNVDAQYNLGAIAEWQEDYDQALKHYLKALSAKPFDQEIKNAVVSCTKKAKECQSAKVMQAQENQNMEFVALSHKAKDAFNKEQYSEAAKYLGILVKVCPGEAKIRFALGQSLRALTNLDWAVYQFKMAVYLDPGNDLYKTTLAEFEREIQTWQEKAYFDSTEVALAYIKPFAFGDAAEIGL